MHSAGRRVRRERTEGEGSGCGVFGPSSRS